MATFKRSASTAERSYFRVEVYAQPMTQQQPYTVLRKIDGFELRRYPSYVLVQAAIESDFDRSGNLGFRPLFRYITGDNAASSKIAMTAPVIQQERGKLDNIVSFVLPQRMDVASVPVPRDETVSIKQVPAHDAAGLTSVGSVYYARFDPPWMPGFARHNEALIAVESPAY